MAQIGQEWFVLRTRSRHEKAVTRILEQKQVHNYLPLLSRKARSGNAEIPVFPGYVFVKPSPGRLHEMNFIPGTCGLILQQGKPGVVREQEIHSIRCFLNLRLSVNIHTGLVPGTWVTVLDGPLIGVRGELIRVKGSNRLVVNAHILGRAVSVDLHAASVSAISNEPKSVPSHKFRSAATDFRETPSPGSQHTAAA